MIGNILLGKFGAKSQNYQLKLKFGTYTNSSMQNSMVIFTFSVVGQESAFWANLVKKIKIVSSRWNSTLKLIQICRIKWRCSLFFISEWKYRFWANLVRKIKIISLSWNLVPTVIQTCRVQWWCPPFLFLIGNTLFGQIWCKKSKLSV